MLRYFYEKTEEDTSALFRKLVIWKQGEKYTREQGKYPVIFVTFKDVKSVKWDVCLRKLQDVVRMKFTRHYYLLESTVLKPHEEREFQEILSGTAGMDRYESGFKKLSLWLERYHHQRAIVLIDEYDTPIQEGYLHGYYDEVIGFMCNLLGAALKGNESLEKAVLTGIMQVSKKACFPD
jgi:hypothetical protein